MSDNKKYYYLKLKDNFFESDEMVILESMPDGYKYSNILLKLYLRSLKNEGKLMFNSRIPFNSQMLSTITRHSVGDVEKAIGIFKQLGLIEVLDNGAIYMLDIQSFVGQSSTEADRIRNYRKKIASDKKPKIGVDKPSVQMYDKSTPEIEIELEKEIKIELEKEIEPEEENATTATTTTFPKIDNANLHSKFANAWQEEIGQFTSMVFQSLQASIKDMGKFTDTENIYELLNYALAETVNGGDRKPKYFWAIIKSIVNNRCKTPEDAKSRWLEKSNSRKSFSKLTKKVEAKPVYITPEIKADEVDIQSTKDKLAALRSTRINND